MPFDVSKFMNLSPGDGEYEGQLDRIRGQKQKTDQIEEAVELASKNLKLRDPKPFIIYGEPQSGKTEMMICLTARLIDDGFKIVIPLLNDSLSLLGQNLGRFQASGINPTPVNFSEILDPVHDLSAGEHIVFCKKNAKDMQNLLDKIDGLGQVVIIDDEADYASPNSKVNSGAKSKINELVDKLIGRNGRYIGVTATPARNDLNNTFGNVTDDWIEFRTHDAYNGQDDFFPMEGDLPYSLCLLPDSYDGEIYPRQAFFRYLVRNAFLNLGKPKAEFTNYSMLLHTSGKVDEHDADMKLIQSIVQSLENNSSKHFERYAKEIWEIGTAIFDEATADKILKFILTTIGRRKLIILNSKQDAAKEGVDASHPKALYTVVFGGNIISRGFTLNNLLSMYFTRDVTHKIQQDTYIQRARMFGVRGAYLEHFELTIPEGLYWDWHRCFFFHRLALVGRRNGNPPSWIADKRVNVAAASSIDKGTVVKKSGEMRFGLFKYSLVSDVLHGIPTGKVDDTDAFFEELKAALSEDELPRYVIGFIQNFDGGGSGVAWYPPTELTGTEDASRGDDYSKLQRSRNIWGNFDRDRVSQCVHHFRVYYHSSEGARLIYRYDSDNIRSLNFLKNAS